MPGRRFVFGVDLDGVVADFYAALRPIAAEWFGVDPASLPTDVRYGVPEWGISSEEEYRRLHRFAVTRRDLFLKLPPMKRAPAVLRRLSDREIHIRIITHRLYINFFHREAASQTIEWLENHGIPYRDLCLMEEKAAVGADLYVEDAPTNVSLLRGENLPTIVFLNSTNRDLAPPHVSTWDELEELVLEAQSLWEAGRWPQTGWRANGETTTAR